MKRLVTLVLALTSILLILSTSCARNEEYAAPDVCLDAGHGGEDYGAVISGKNEKADTLKMTLAVQSELIKRDINVVLTRKDDSYVSLQDRTDTANKSGAKLFVSIHRNSAKNSQGVEIWINSENIWADRVLAENIMVSLEEVGISKNRGIKLGFRSDDSENYYINSNTDIPSCLLELGFMGDKTDDKMYDEKNIDKYAEAIAEAIEITLADISK